MLPRCRLFWYKTFITCISPSDKCKSMNEYWSAIDEDQRWNSRPVDLKYTLHKLSRISSYPPLDVSISYPYGDLKNLTYNLASLWWHCKMRSLHLHFGVRQLLLQWLWNQSFDWIAGLQSVLQKLVSQVNTDAYIVYYALYRENDLLIAMPKLLLPPPALIPIQIPCWQFRLVQELLQPFHVLLRR